MEIISFCHKAALKCAQKLGDTLPAPANLPDESGAHPARWLCIGGERVMRKKIGEEGSSPFITQHSSFIVPAPHGEGTARWLQGQL